MNAHFNELSCTMRVKEIVDENFQDYKKPAMLISSVSCDFKCLKELGMDIGICQNMKISKLPNKTVSKDTFQTPSLRLSFLAALSLFCSLARL